jgi:hypothetical protein
MYKIQDIAFDKYYLKSVELELESCDVLLKVIFYKDDKKIEREKIYRISSDCNVEINDIIKELEVIIKNGEGIL